MIKNNTHLREHQIERAQKRSGRWKARHKCRINLFPRRNENWRFPSEGLVTATPWRPVTGRKKDFEKKLKIQNIRLWVIMILWENIHFETILPNAWLSQYNKLTFETISNFWGNCLLTSSENCWAIHEKKIGKSHCKEGNRTCNAHYTGRSLTGPRGSRCQKCVETETHEALFWPALAAEQNMIPSR